VRQLEYLSATETPIIYDILISGLLPFERLSMAWTQFPTAFATIFPAELGDKTQIAMITMSASSKQPLSVFLGGAIAMVLLSGIAVIAGELVTRYVPESVLSKVAAVLFMAMGIWTWFKH
jgi:Ca2+/H+ antiporter, TMEM165/GDT1 family